MSTIDTSVKHSGSAKTSAIKVIVPSGAIRKWHDVLLSRLVSAGHAVVIEVSATGGSGALALNSILSLEGVLLRGGERLAARIRETSTIGSDKPLSLVIDLTEQPASKVTNTPTLSVLFNGDRKLCAAAVALCQGSVPNVELVVDGQCVGHAAPMADSRVWLTKGLNDVLARSITLICTYIKRSESGSAERIGASSETVTRQPKSPASLLAVKYLCSMLPRLLKRIVLRTKYNPGHWFVGYRFTDDNGVAELGSMHGIDWIRLPENGDRFYADPFPFEWQGRYFIFVEELVHANPKGFISVAEYGTDGIFATPVKVLEEPYHMSYPQVFVRDDEVWMIPETGGGRQVALYRAESFPTRWVKHCVLIDDREIFDATLIEHDGLLWIIGTERDGGGSASDTMVVFFADALEGPWVPHPGNPIVIDKVASRPGGGAIYKGNDIFLAMQDGTNFYGGGIGLSRIIKLDQTTVKLSYPTPIEPGSDPHFRHVHTLNRHGRLEVIDGFSDWVRRPAKNNR